MDLRRDRVESRLTPVGVAVRVATGLAGAWLVLRASWSASDLGAPERRWAVVAVTLLCLALAWALPELRRLLPRPGDAPLVVAAVLLAAFLCVPETDQVLRIAFVVTVLAIGEGVGRWRAPLVVVGLVAAYVMWAGVYGATGRQSALVGALVAWWPVLILPLLALWRPGVSELPVGTRGVVVAIAAAASVLVARTGALAPTIGPALVATAVALPASLAAAAAVATVSVRRSHGTSHPSA